MSVKGKPKATEFWGPYDYQCGIRTIDIAIGNTDKIYTLNHEHGEDIQSRKEASAQCINHNLYGWVSEELLDILSDVLNYDYDKSSEKINDLLEELRKVEWK